MIKEDYVFNNIQILKNSSVQLEALLLFYDCFLPEQEDSLSKSQSYTKLLKEKQSICWLCQTIHFPCLRCPRDGLMFCVIFWKADNLSWKYREIHYNTGQKSGVNRLTMGRKHRILLLTLLMILGKNVFMLSVN